MCTNTMLCACNGKTLEDFRPTTPTRAKKRGKRLLSGRKIFRSDRGTVRGSTPLGPTIFLQETKQKYKVVVCLLGVLMRKRELSIVTFLVLFLLPVFAQGFDIDRDLGVGELYSVSRFANTDWRIEGSFSVDSDIEFFICDADNYNKWVNNQTALLYEHQEQVTSYTFNFTIPHDAIWYIIFSNAFSPGIIGLEAELYYKNQAGIAQTQVTWIIQSTIMTPLLIGFILAVLVVCLLGIWMSRRSEPQPAVRYEEILPKPD